MSDEQPSRPTDSYAANPDRTERILFFVTVGALLVVALVVVIVLLF
jgi:hypothetical protein